MLCGFYNEIIDYLLVYSIFFEKLRGLILGKVMFLGCFILKKGKKNN